MEENRFTWNLEDIYPDEQAWYQDLSKAKELLAGRKLTMVDIAAATGYNSVESFRRAFKRVVGMTPSEYQESLQKN